MILIGYSVSVKSLPERKSQKLVVYRKTYYKTKKKKNALQIETSHLKQRVLIFRRGDGCRGFLEWLG